MTTSLIEMNGNKKILEDLKVTVNKIDCLTIWMKIDATVACLLWILDCFMMPVGRKWKGPIAVKLALLGMILVSCFRCCIYSCLGNLAHR